MRSTLIIGVFCTILLNLGFLIAGCRKEKEYPTTLWQGISNLPKHDTGKQVFCPSWVCLPNDFPFASRWTSLPNNGALGTAVSDGPRIFIGGGHEEGGYGGAISQVSIFNAENDKVETNFNLSEGRSHLSGVLVGDQVIFAGGQDSTVYGNSFFSRVDLIHKTNLSQSTAELSEARASIASASNAEVAYFAGGRNNSGCSRKMDIYNVANNQWKAIDMPRERAYATAFFIGAKLYIAGGLDYSQGDIKIIDIYNSQDGTWTTMEAPHTHHHAYSILLGGKIYIAGGDGASNGYVDILDTTTLTWSSFSLSDSRFDMSIAGAKDKVIFMGGNYSPNVDVYNSLTRETYSGKMNIGVSGMSASTYQNKCIFSGFLADSGNASAGNLTWIIDL
jgi:hypothetical protein